MLAQNGRGEGSKAFSKFDLQIHDTLHALRARVAQNAAPTQGPGPKLHAALKPADHFLLSQQGGDVVQQIMLVCESTISSPGGSQNFLNSSNAKTRPQHAAFLAITEASLPP